MSKIEFYKYPIVEVKLDFTDQKDDILAFTLAHYAKMYEKDYREIGNMMGVIWGDSETPNIESYYDGLELLEKYKRSKLCFLFPREIFWDFIGHPQRNQYDFILFRAFQALKTIVSDKPYCKITNDYFVARMCGCEKVEDFKNKYLWHGKPRSGNVLAQYWGNAKKMRKLKRDLEKTYNGVKFFCPPNCRGYYATTKENVSRIDIARMVKEQERIKQARNLKKEIENDEAMKIWNSK